LPPEEWTRENYLRLSWLGDVPKEPLDAELEAEIPMDELIDDRVIDISTRRPVGQE